MKMTVEELISMLEDYDSDAEVRIMYQATYPLVEVLVGVTSKKELMEDEQNVAAGDYQMECDECGEPVNECTCGNCEFKGPNVVYLMADGHPNDECYGTRIAWDVMRRS